MKKYRLTDPKTILGILSRLINTPVLDPIQKQKYQIKDPTAINDILKSVHFTLSSAEPISTKPSSLTCILKDNRVELRIKLVNPYQDDLFQVTEIQIEPLERSAKRAAIDSIHANEVKVASKIDISTVISLYGKTSIINQALNQWQTHLEQLLTNFGYFIKRVNIGFYYAADTPLMEALFASKAPYYMRDSNKRIFYTDRGFFAPAKLNEAYIRSYLDNHLVNNIKSVLIVPVFSTDKVLLGYFEVMSNLPDLGNASLQDNIDGPQGINPLLSFLDARAAEFVFHLEFSYAKDWETIAKQSNIRDLSQDGGGIGIYIQNPKIIPNLVVGSAVSFQIEINSLMYTFYGSLRSVKNPETEGENHSIGIQIFQCDRPEGLSLIATYSSQLIGQEVV